MDRVRSDEGLREQNQQQAPPPHMRPLEGQIAGANNQQQPPPPPPPPPHRKYPRCDSNDTKFCYYNNYSLSQPRYFCRACRRYWTHGGTLRNVPIGGGSQKGKRPRTAGTARASSSCNEAARTHQSASAPVLPPQNLSVGSQGLRILPPVAPPPVSTIPVFTGGSYLSSLAVMQSLSSSSRTKPGPAINLGGQFGSNMNLLQGISLSPLRPLAPRQFQPQQTTTVFPLQQSFISPRTMPSWTQGLINNAGSSSSPATPPLMNSWTQGLINTAPSTSSATPRPSFFNGTSSSRTTSNDNGRDQAGPSSFISDD